MYSSAVFSWSLALIAKERLGPSNEPLAPLALALPMAVRRLSMLRPLLARARALTWMRTAGLWPPETVTRPTPATWEIFWASGEAAMSSTWVRGTVLEVSARIMIGASAGLTLA